ncbi:MAG TPA: arylesterase [Gammaproteobacteria bacterium]|nr:arylesterase [Gammaproteobacteria bacterium]
MSSVLIPKPILAVLFVLAVLSAPAARCADKTIVVLGDSLSSGYGLATEQSWVSLLEQRLSKEGYGYEVVNASIAGDTSDGGRARLPPLLARHRPAIVVIELGGNDGLRGQPVEKLRKNLAAMIELSRAAGARVVLTGIQIPPNYGPDYTTALASVYTGLAKEYDVPLVDFLLEGVALHPELMQGDRIHPNAKGQAVLFDNVWRVLEPLL